MIRSYAQAMAGQTGVKAGGLTAATFAWQDLDAIGSIQNFGTASREGRNTSADVHAGRTVAQTVNTTPGASYTFSIRYSGRSKGNAGGVTLLTGPDKDHLTGRADPHHGLQDRPETGTRPAMWEPSPTRTPIPWTPRKAATNRGTIPTNRELLRGQRLLSQPDNLGR